jgi:hypothetical protein
MGTPGHSGEQYVENVRCEPYELDETCLEGYDDEMQRIGAMVLGGCARQKRLPRRRQKRCPS